VIRFPDIRSLTLPRLVAVLAVLVALLSQTGAPRAADLSRALAATLVVYTDDMDEAFLGSAFLWRDGSLAITSAHVVGEAGRVELRDATGRRLSARILVRDAQRDIAVIEIPGAVFGPGLEPAERVPGPGAAVYALGAPLGVEFTITAGMISATGRQVEPSSPVRFLQHDAAVNPGSSGGPLVDAEGRLVGMNSLIADGSRLFVGIAYAMTAEDLALLVPRLMAGSLKPVPDLGLMLRPVSRKVAAALELAPGTGLLIDDVADGGLAHRAGLRPGDVILAFDGQSLRVPGDLALAIDGRSADRLVVTVMRGRDLVDLTLDLSPRPAVLARLAGPMPTRIDSYSFDRLGLSFDAEALVRGINPGSPAQTAGLVAGDRIVAVNGRPVSEVDLARFVVDRPVLLLVERASGQTLHVVVDPWGKGRGPRLIGGANVLDPAVVIF